MSPRRVPSCTRVQAERLLARPIVEDAPRASRSCALARSAAMSAMSAMSAMDTACINEKIAVDLGRLGEEELAEVTPRR